MRHHRLPRAVEYIGEFWLPPLPGRDDPPGPKRDTATGRFVKQRRKKRRKAKTRRQARTALRRSLKAMEGRPGEAPRTTCYSATCVECGRVWISAIRPIRDNAIRNGVNVYLCGNCRD